MTADGPEDWSPEGLLAAVGSGVLPDGDGTSYRGTLDGTDLLVVLRRGDDPQEYAVRFATGDVPTSPWTGEECATPEEWAHDIRWAVTEEVATGLVRRGLRAPLPDGVVELDPLQHDPAYRPPPEVFPQSGDRVVVQPPSGQEG